MTSKWYDVLLQSLCYFLPLSSHLIVDQALSNLITAYKNLRQRHVFLYQMGDYYYPLF